MLNLDFFEDVELELTTLCNAKCPLCYRNSVYFDKHYPKTIIRPLNKIIEQLEQFKNIKYIRLVGSISEPTLYKDLFKLIEYLNARKILIEICTNGDTHNEDYWRELGRILKETDKVYFTICGSTQELHETYRSGTSLKNILRNAKALRESKHIDYCQCIRFNYNDNDLNSNTFLKMVSDFSHKYFTETFLFKDTNLYKNKIDIEKFKPAPKKIKKYIKCLKLTENVLKHSGCECQAYLGRWCQIDIYGNIYPCYFFLEESQGKLWNGNWREIRNGKYHECRFCKTYIRKFINENDLSYII